MGFVMAGLDKEDYDREYGDIFLLRRIINYLSPYKKQLLIISVSIILGSLTQTLIPLYFSFALNDLSDSQTGNISASNAVFMLAVLILVFFVFSYFMNMIQQEVSAKAIQSAVVDLRKDAFDAVLKVDMSFINESYTGRLVSRIVNDSTDFGQLITLTTSLIGQLLTVVFILYFLLQYSIRLTILVIIFAPAVIITALLFRKIARDIARKSQRVLALVNALTQETFTGIYIAKVFRAEKLIYDEFEDLNTTSYNVNLRRGLTFNTIFPVLGVLTGIGTAMLVYFGGLNVIGANTFFGQLILWLPSGHLTIVSWSSGTKFTLLSWQPIEHLTIGDWFLFFQGLNLFFFPLVSIASFWSQFQQGLASSERVFSLIDKENIVVQSDNKIIQQPKGEIEFKNLTFAYKDVNILEHFNLHIKPGEKIAIVGHTGAGKSTIAKLIARSYEYQSGGLYIDGQDIRSLDLAEYRKNLAIITQEVFLWNDTIIGNLLYGSGHIQDAKEKMIGILAKLEIMDWINRFDKGLETNVGERGSRLSMGQRQLIAFARILLLNPTILIMDEATSSVDPFTELMIQRAINLLLEGRTSIIIAHRLSTVKHVDRIIVLKEGKIIEAGSHEELLNAGGHYAELYDTYFRHQSLAYVDQFSK